MSDDITPAQRPANTDKAPVSPPNRGFSVPESHRRTKALIDNVFGETDLLWFADEKALGEAMAAAHTFTRGASMTSTARRLAQITGLPRDVVLALTMAHGVRHGMREGLKDALRLFLAHTITIYEVRDNEVVKTHTYTAPAHQVGKVIRSAVGTLFSEEVARSLRFQEERSTPWSEVINLGRGHRAVVTVEVAPVPAPKGPVVLAPDLIAKWAPLLDGFPLDEEPFSGLLNTMADLLVTLSPGATMADRPRAIAALKGEPS